MPMKSHNIFDIIYKDDEKIRDKLAIFLLLALVIAAIILVLEHAL